MREDHYAEALAYLPKPSDAILRVYTKSLADGANNALSREDRARAWFRAAWIARYDGMELMGTEVAPDAFAAGGNFEEVDLASERRTGKYKTTPSEGANEKGKTLPIIVQPTKQELDRIGKNRIVPDVRFHYRIIAGTLAMKAADLLPDNSESLADVVNHAGLWVKDRQEKIADHYFDVLKRRCPQTEIGRHALARHWFIDEVGEWSTRAAQERAKMRKDLGMPERPFE